jgi:LPS-assembly lipoprotein
MSLVRRTPGSTRSVRRTLVSAGALLAVGGCGFALRRAPALPFRSIALVGFAPDSPLAAELRARLAESAQVQAAPARADAVLQALTDARERVVVASTATGQVRELQLRVRLRFRVSTPAGRELLPPAELLLVRDMSYSESVALAKEQEQAQLYRAMDEDIAAQVLRRLAAVKLG